MTAPNRRKIISPISIDLGAKSTGVFFAHYEAGAGIADIEKKRGRVYVLDKASHTLLMAGRTAARHGRRGHDRRQMAKRLFKLIWKEHFGYKWDNDVQRTVSFLLNRRGFSYLSEMYNEEILEDFPQDILNMLPECLREKLRKHAESAEVEEYNLSSVLQEAARGDMKNIRDLHETADAIWRLHNLNKCCKATVKDNDAKNLTKVPGKIVSKWKEIGIAGLDNATERKDGSVNIAECIKEDVDRRKIADSIVKLIGDIAIKENLWNLKKDFSIEEYEDRFILPNNDGKKLKEYKQAHVRHLLYAIEKIFKEKESGGRHRRKYFEEVNDVLKNCEISTTSDKFVRTFCTKLKNGEYKGLNADQELDDDKLARLIGHISNLELKPLNRFFNDISHMKGDHWNKHSEGRLSKIFDHWIKNQWRVDSDKDLDKKEGKEGDYFKLKRLWKKHKRARKSSVIDFWLDPEMLPVYTIPPYQNQNNRRPPRCQSFILNATALNKKYPEWEQWLKALISIESVGSYICDYKNKLREVETGANKSYFDEELSDINGGTLGRKHLNARVLQFILDRVKKDDTLNLNEIYARIKKIRQIQKKQEAGGENLLCEEKTKLLQALKKSELCKGTDFFIDELRGIIERIENKADNYSAGILQEKGFLFFTYKYYKLRQRAKENRIFIHPDYRQHPSLGMLSTGHYQDSCSLLTYCNHTPRAKRHQVAYDIAGLLQVPLELLTGKIGCGAEAGLDVTNKKLIEWLEEKKIKSACAAAAKWQKDKRGELDAAIQEVYAGQHVTHELYRDCETARKKWMSVMWEFRNEEECLREEQRLMRNPSAAVFQLAQIHNIAFKDRNGNAKTCAVCSMDNLSRMQMYARKDGSWSAKAKRLSAVKMRVIDGAIKRYARILSKAIAEDKWIIISAALRKGNTVCVPIITESNRFEFEPALRKLKGKSKPNDDKLPEKGRQEHAKKEARIKKTGVCVEVEGTEVNICPYTGEAIEIGEIDHIIPRSSGYKTLNDEANLIYASRKGNQTKANNKYFLGHLKPAYKNKIFPCENKTHDGIRAWIVEQIGDAEDEKFKFGDYLSFISLTDNEKIAFRHALFLYEGDLLREKVINAIDSRNRAYVNGTQRYFAEVIANELHKKALKKGWSGKLNFDYYEVEAGSQAHSNNVHDLRRDYEDCWKWEKNNDLMSYSKGEKGAQKAYSHLIDATLTFILAADNHRYPGGMKLKIPDDARIGPYDSQGEMKQYKGSFFQQIAVPDDDIDKELGRRSVTKVETHYRLKWLQRNKHYKKENDVQTAGTRKSPRKVKQNVPYKIFGDTFYAEHFLPLQVDESKNIAKIGFSIEHAIEIGWEKQYLLIKDYYKPAGPSPFLRVPRKREILELLMKGGSEKGLTDNETEICKLIDTELRYLSINVKIIDALTPTVNGRKQEKDAPSSVEEALANWDKCIKESDFIIKHGGGVKIILPAYKRWERLGIILAAKVKENPDTPLQIFLEDYFKANAVALDKHQKARRVFSLPMKPAGIKAQFRIRRQSWSGEEDDKIIQMQCQERGNKAWFGKNRPHTMLSKNTVPVGHYNGCQDLSVIVNTAWISVPQDEIPDYLESAMVCDKQKSRCLKRIMMKEEFVPACIRGLFDDASPRWKGQLAMPDDKNVAKDNSEETSQGNDKNAGSKCYLSEEDSVFIKLIGRGSFGAEKKNNNIKVLIKKIDNACYQFEYLGTKTKPCERWLAQEEQID